MAAGTVHDPACLPHQQPRRRAGAGPSTALGAARRDLDRRRPTGAPPVLPSVAAELAEAAARGGGLLQKAARIRGFLRQQRGRGAAAAGKAAWVDLARDLEAQR
jgi:hypothetical protein